MKRLLPILLFLLLFPLYVTAANDDLIVEIVPDRQSVMVGDSMLVSVVLYSSAPIVKAECYTHFKVKGKCKVRRLSINRDATAGRVYDGDRIYYRLVWAQYVVAPEAVAEMVVPVQKFRAVLRETTYMPDMFDRMIGAQPEYQDFKVKAASLEVCIQVENKPMRSTLEMMRNGVVL